MCGRPGDCKQLFGPNKRRSSGANSGRCRAFQLLIVIVLLILDTALAREQDQDHDQEQNGQNQVGSQRD